MSLIQSSIGRKMIMGVCGAVWAGFVLTHMAGNMLIFVSAEAEGGTMETYKVSTPALVAANKGLNKPRFASLPNIMKAKKKPIKDMTAADLGVAAGNNAVSFEKFELPKDRAPVKMITGDAKSQAKELVRLLREEAKVL